MSITGKFGTAISCQRHAITYAKSLRRMIGWGAQKEMPVALVALFWKRKVQNHWRLGKE